MGNASRGLRLAALFIVALSFSGGAAVADNALPSFKHGATLVEFFEFPATVGDGASKTYANPPYPRAFSALTLFDFDELHRIGFDHMRVPLDVGPLMTGDQQEQRKIIDDLLAVIAAINRHGLAVLVTLFPAVAAA